jgi:hypothetical protein
VKEATSHGLLNLCRVAATGGADFPTVWHTVLKPHGLVIGPPIQHPDGLEIRLITGSHIRYHSETNSYALG